MRLTKREQTLVSLLRAAPRTGTELAEALAVSRRTVVREVAAINAKLGPEGAGRIESGQSYRLIVSSEEALSALLRDGLSDELAVLLAALTSPEPSLASLSQETYLSRRALQAAIADVNRDYGVAVRLEPRSGRGVEVTLTSVGAADVLASQAAESRIWPRAWRSWRAGSAWSRSCARAWMPTSGRRVPTSRPVRSTCRPWPPWPVRRAPATAVGPACACAPLTSSTRASVTCSLSW